MIITGYGYRKNCFGERIFFEDEMVCHSRETAEKVLKKAFNAMRKDQTFSIKVSAYGQSYAVNCLPFDREHRQYSVIYSPRWNVTNPEQKMKRAAIMRAIMELCFGKGDK